MTSEINLDEITTTTRLWSCLTMGEDCPFLANADPKLYYFVLGLIGFYAAFFLLVLADLNFIWPLDCLHRQVDHYITLVREKVTNIQREQRRLVSTQERSEKQLRKSEQSMGMVMGLRSVLQNDDPKAFSIFNNAINEENTVCSEMSDLLDF